MKTKRSIIKRFFNAIKYINRNPMLRKLQFRFIIILMTIASVLTFALLYTFNVFSRNSVQDSLLAGMERIADNPEGILSDDSSFDYYIYSAFFVDNNGNIQKILSSYYDEKFIKKVYDTINTQWDNNNYTFVIPRYALSYYYKYSDDGCWYIVTDCSYDIAYQKQTTRICIALFILSLIIYFFVALLLSVWLLMPVQKSWKQQKEFIADASHELKTPLTVILTNAELLQNKNFSEYEVQKFKSNILTEAHQMKYLITSLLDLARIDRGLPKENFVDVNFSKLCEDESLIMEVELFERGHLLESDIEKNIHVKGDFGKLKEVIEILLDNAGKYASSQSKILFNLKTENNKVTMSVSDYGDPIPKEELHKIFQRFYRMDSSRTLNGSYGLGLSIAQEIIAQHKGTIFAESKNGLNTFYVHLTQISGRNAH
ncbi:sensor histidine kinase [Butyrivibrio sp. NC3005]|uniref:sensor histidine kinase n=1 Tax=Butyrivibrio sp. NC3005 TaxID=1280685 RepID=UPI000685153C|nr:HAMP domain-containing sensor histidine kinase [Butyrivibrio sp. NC3005]